jgi:hypothetical protein
MVSGDGCRSDRAYQNKTQLQNLFRLISQRRFDARAFHCAGCEIQSSTGLMGREQEFLDSLHVMEVGMRHFFAKAMHAKANNGKPETIGANMLQAVSIAEKIAPYKHTRLSVVKLAGDPNNPARFKDDASVDELREEIMRRIGILVSAGLIDLKALPMPRGVDQSAINGVDQLGINGS